MNAPRFEAILNYADAVRRAAEMDTFPLDAEELVSRLGGKLNKRQPGEPTQEIKVHARVLPGEGMSFTLDPVRYHDETLNRFAIVKILGNLLLHTTYMKDRGLTKEFSSDPARHGVACLHMCHEADLFAYATLMPQGLFCKVAELHIVNSYHNTHAIGAHFGVRPRHVQTYGRILATFRWGDR
jgi:hypothetical protein